MQNSKIDNLIASKKRVASLMIPSRAVIIGCGGIGSHLWDFIAQEMWSRSEINKDRALPYNNRKPVVREFLLIDNDLVEHKNLFRQSYFPEHIGSSKSDALASKYSEALKANGIKVETKQLWIDDKTDLFNNGDFVLLCVDNHATRKMINDIILPDKRVVSGRDILHNITLVNGGNTGTLVTLQIMQVLNGRLVTASLEHMHPDITQPTDKHPRDVACTDRVAAINDPQLFRANLMAATQMFQVFMNAVEARTIDYCELWMDVANQSYRKVDIPDKEIIT